MKALYRFILGFLDEVDNIVSKEGRDYATYYGKEAVRIFCQDLMLLYIIFLFVFKVL